MPNTTYRRANTDWLAACTVGLGVHWTAQTVPRSGAAAPFATAVEHFRLPEFLAAVEASGADYVIFTLTHALQCLPCPHAVVDAILPGRTSERDLIGELAQGVAALGKKFIVYYNHSCNQGDDPPWERAVGYHDPEKDLFAENLCAIIEWLGNQYGPLIQSFWFDSAYSLDPHGPCNSVTTDLRGFQFPWERYTAAAKAGYPERLVTYNPGVDQTFLYTEHQDYWAGELSKLHLPPTARYLDNGLQWHGWTCLDDPAWVYHDNRQAPHLPFYEDRTLAAFVAACRRHQAPICFNVMSFQDGTLADESIQQLSRIVASTRK